MLEALRILFTSMVFAGMITGKMEVESLCYTTTAKQVTDCKIHSYYFDLEDQKTHQHGTQRVTPDIYNRQKPGDLFYCNTTTCLDMPKGTL